MKMLRFLLVSAFCVSTALGNVWVRTNDVLSIGSPFVGAASAGELRLRVFVRQGADAVSLSGCTSRWLFVDTRDGYQIPSIIAGTTEDATNGAVQFVASGWSRVGTFTATARIYPPSAESYVADSMTVTITSTASVVVNVTGGSSSVGVTAGVSSVTASNGIIASGSNTVGLSLDTSTQIGVGWPKLLLKSESNTFYWSDVLVSTTGGINVVLFTNSATYSALASTSVVDQSFVVPGGTTQLAVKAWGGGGGGSVAYAGGAGGFSFGVISVTPGESLIVRVAQGGRHGSSSIQALPGGGLSVTSSASAGYYAGNGGGYSAVLRGTNLLVVAAGGGGGGGSTTAGASGGVGGAGGSSIGASGSGTISWVQPIGGSQTNGGSAGRSSNSVNTAATDGVFLLGGNGARAGNTAHGGGGGGGYYGGGGGGASNSVVAAGGAGGSCFAPAPYGLSIRGNNTGDEDWQASWGAAGGTSSAGADGKVIIKWP